MRPLPRDGGERERKRVQETPVSRNLQVQGPGRVQELCWTGAVWASASRWSLDEV